MTAPALGDYAALILAAQAKSDTPSRRALAKKMGLSHSALQFPFDGKTTPSDETLTALCELAGIDPKPWLVDLRTRHTGGEAREQWATILEQLTPCPNNAKRPDAA